MAILALMAVMPLSVVLGASAQENMAMVRVVHASPDAPAVDVWVDGTQVLQGVEFTQGSEYLSVPAGAHQIVVTPAGGDASQAVIDATVTVEGGMNYTIAAVGTLDSMEPTVIVDDSSEPAQGMAHVRVLHTAPDAPAVDIAAANGPVLFENLAFMEVSDYAPVDAGAYDLQVRPTGTEDSALDISGLPVEAGVIYSVFAMGQVGDGTLQAVVFTDMAMQATGTGGGTPGMPATGSGGGALDTGSAGISWLALGVVSALAMLIAGGSAALATRRVRP